MASYEVHRLKVRSGTFFASLPRLAPLLCLLIRRDMPPYTDHCSVRLPCTPSSAPLTRFEGKARTGETSSSPYSHESLTSVRKTAPVSARRCRSTSHLPPSSMVFEVAGA